MSSPTNKQPAIASLGKWATAGTTTLSSLWSASHTNNVKFISSTDNILENYDTSKSSDTISDICADSTLSSREQVVTVLSTRSTPLT